MSFTGNGPDLSSGSRVAGFAVDSRDAN